MLAGTPALAYTYAGNYTFTARWDEWARYKQGAYTIYPAEHRGGFEYDVCPALQTRTLFPSVVVGSVKQTCNNLWNAFLSSPHLLGSAATGVRARDVSEDWDLNYIDPADPLRNYYFDWYANSLLSNPYVLRISYPLNLQPLGPHAGAYTLSNPNVLAMGDDTYVMRDPDGSLSYYAYVGGWLLKDSTAKTFTNGAWAGQALTSKLKHLIGYEELQLYFLEGDSTLHVFDRDLKWVRTDLVKLGDELSAYTLGQLVDNQIPGYTYIGWDAGPIVIGVTALRPLDHFLVSTSVTQVEVGQSLTLTIRACEDAGTCNTPHVRGVSGTLLLSDGTLQAFTIPRNSSSVQLTLPINSRPLDGMLNISLPATEPLPTAIPGTLCQFGDTASPSSDCRIPVLPPFKHVELSGPATGLTCAASTFTIKACGSTDCQSGYTQGLSGTLLVGGAATQASPSTSIGFTIPAGRASTTVSLQVTRPPADGKVPLSITGLSATAGDASALYCALGQPATAAASCEHQVSRSGFIVQAPDHVAESSGITAQVTAIRSNLDQSACVPAFTGSKAVTLSCAHVTPSSASTALRIEGQALNGSGSASEACDVGGRPVTLNFQANGVAQASLAYADVGRMRLKATLYGGAGDPDAGMSGETTFVVAPAGFVVDRPEVSPGAILAGAPFSLRLRAVNSLGAATPGFGRIDGAVSHTLSMGWTLTEPSGSGARAGVFSGSGTAGGNALSAADFNNQGEATVSDLRWSEVGRGRVTAELSRPQGWLDSNLAPSGQSAPIGPFVPAYFDPELSAGCTGFTYSGQGLGTLTVTARNAQGGVTQNFDGSGALTPSHASAITWQLDPIAAGAGALSESSLAATRFVAGVGRPLGAVSYTFANKQTAPLTAQLGVIRGDGHPSSQSVSRAWPVRSGRLVLSDAYGSERTPLELPVQAQHWSGKSWTLNAADGCTRIPSAAVALSNHRGQSGAPMSAFATPPVTQATLNGQAQAIVIQGGHGVLRLSAPPPGVTGALDVALNLGGTANDRACSGSHPATTGAAQPWLRAPLGSSVSCPLAQDRDPGAKATFGIFSPESRRVIHAQDLY